MTADPVVDADFAAHVATYRSFLIAVMWAAGSIVAVLVLLAYFFA